MNKDAVGEIRAALLAGDYPGLLAALRANATVTVTGDGCWLWRDLNSSAYPKAVRLPGGTASGLHRQVLEAKLGVPLGKRHVLHTCGVSACVNPDHLQATSLRDQGEPARRAPHSRVAELEAALREVRPDHPLLSVRPRQCLISGHSWQLSRDIVDTSAFREVSPCPRPSSSSPRSSWKGAAKAK